MGWFSRRKQNAVPDAGAAEHAVIVHLRLGDDEHGTVEERESVFRLEDRLEALIEAQGAGEFDGNEFGGGEAVLYCYGPDADRLWQTIEAEVRSFPTRPAFVTLRYGDASDPGAREQRIDL